MERTVKTVLEKATSGAEGDGEGVQRELSKYGFRYIYAPHHPLTGREYRGMAKTVSGIYTPSPPPTDREGVQRELSKYGFRYLHAYIWT
jgi:hypothetical protein